jgi:serine/threonine protein kinase
MLESGKRVGRYTIVAPVGAGAKGEVYRAEDARDGTAVAIKVLPERYAEDRIARGRFSREIAALAALSHPNVLRILEFGDENGIVYAVTELLEGESLKQRLARGPMAWQAAAAAGVEIADGLAAIHAKGILHRDLKPDNVFLTPAGAKILDFGLARIDADAAASPDDSLKVQTAPGVMLGTVPYMAPEHICGLAVDARSDVFSFGCLLYAMLLGRDIYRRRSMVAAMAAILEEPPPALSSAGLDVPPALESAVRRCVEKAAERRFQSAADAAAALRAI